MYDAPCTQSKRIMEIALLVSDAQPRNNIITPNLRRHQTEEVWYGEPRAALLLLLKASRGGNRG